MLDRKKDLLKYVLNARQQFIKILVLVRWAAANSQDVQSCRVCTFLRIDCLIYQAESNTIWLK